MIFNVWVSSVAYTVPFLMLFIILLFAFIDSKKNREVKSHPFISFIMPCYNDEDNVENAVKSIYASYDNFELFIINDKSKDSSLKILTKLRHKYKFNLIDNAVNKGKSRSINSIVNLTRGEIIFIVDSDIILTKNAVNDIIARFDYDKTLAAVSCAYRVRNKGLLARLQDIEYSGLRLVKFSQNIVSALSLWGGCLAVKRKPFLEVKMFSENMLVEDIDLALKLNKNGYRVEQSWIYVMADAPTSFKSWIKQKIRWSSGGVQCLLAYPMTYLKNPIQAVFTLSNIILTIVFVFYLFAILGIIYLDIIRSSVVGNFSLNNLLIFLGLFDLKVIAHSIFVKFGFMTLSLPSIFMLIKSPKELYKLFYGIPFSIIYSPLYTLLYFLVAWPIGVKKYFELRNGGRAW